MSTDARYDENNYQHGSLQIHQLHHPLSAAEKHVQAHPFHYKEMKL